jgi:MurNAc alpha-1-phosphate uridylyltransferase
MRARNLKALILAAGRGERMRPLTDHIPKPLLPVRGKPLIEWHIAALARAGVTNIVINTAWLEEQFPAALGNGARWGLAIEYSMEGRDHGGALETAGGIAKALPLLGACFWVVSGDIFAPEFAFDAETAQAFAQSSRDDSLLWLVPNPSFNAGGDFALDDAGRVQRPPTEAERRWTYANLALMRDRQVAGVPPGVPTRLGPLLFVSAAQGRLAGRAWSGAWHNVGSADQIDALNRSSA